MFAKVSLQIVVDSVIDDFCFLSPEVIGIYQKNGIIKCFV